ncbi:MAG: N-acetyl sugar amidotransferase [bacterium]
MKQCTRCIQTEAYPGIKFDEQGVCSLCHAFDRRWRGREASESEKNLQAILSKARRLNPKYQAIVGLSGGKDSSYTAHLMVKRYKVNVLALTHDNGFLSDGARKNIDLMVKKLGIEHRQMSLNPDLRKKMYQSLIKNRCTDLCMVCVSDMLSSMNQLALKEGIPLIVWGLSPRTEPIFVSEVSCTMDWRYLLSATRPHLKRSDLGDLRYIDLPWLFYVLIVRGIRHVMLPEYVPWHDRDIAEFLSREYGWVDYGDGSHHFDCSAYPAMEYFMYRRLGMTKTSELVSQLVRSGQLSRDDALVRMKTCETVSEPVESVKRFCSQVGVSRDEIQPFLEGKTFDYHHFSGYTALLERMSWVFWLTHKMGITTESFYEKYKRR